MPKFNFVAANEPREVGMASLKESFAARLSGLQVEGFRGGDPNDPRKPRDPPVPLTAQEVSDLEKSLGETLPEEYRRFLLNFGGAAFYAVGVRPIETREPYHDHWLLEMLFGGRDDKPSHDLWSNLAVYKDRIPGHMIPIGGNLCSDLFLLAIKGPDRGKVYFWDHGDTRKLYLTAESFDDFLDRLVPEEE